MSKKKGVTLLLYWEKLDYKQRRLIVDLLKQTSKRRYLTMALLPFIPVKEVIRVLEKGDHSPWTLYRLHQAYDDRDDRDYIDTKAALERYRKSAQYDTADYQKIIRLLTEPVHETPTHLAEQLAQWSAARSAR